VNTTEWASDEIIARIQLMAQFVASHHPDEFAKYWRDNKPGKADPREFLEFIVNPVFKEKYMIMAKEVFIL
jgi:hypothetical protein